VERPVTACVLDHGDQRGEAVDGLLLCQRHLRQLTDDCTEIGLLIVDSQRITDGGAPADNSPRTRKLKRADPPAPGDITLIAMYDERTSATRLPGTTKNPDGDQSQPLSNVLHTVGSWLLLIAEERPLTADLPRSVLAQLDLIKRHGDWCAAQSWVDDLLRELREVRQGLRSVLNDRTHTRIGTCDLPTEDERPCGGALLVENGSSVIRCGRCKAEWATAQEQARLRVRLG
jgi:hypothetical protein